MSPDRSSRSSRDEHHGDQSVDFGTAIDVATLAEVVGIHDWQIEQLIQSQITKCERQRRDLLSAERQPKHNNSGFKPGSSQDPA